jgi:NAD(P)-dependent dehydrogenase (short-subunit alcohol dehydrogenase family)
MACARPGAVLHLSGRDAARLDAVAAAARDRGAAVHPARLDVRDAAAMAGWIAGAGPLDLVVANAGISAGTGGGGAPVRESAAQVRAIFAVNLDGALNTVLPALEAMAAQMPGSDGVRGRIAVIASLAALVAAPGAPAYCASKAAVDAWTVASAPAARDRGVVLTSVCPGYVRTPMTARNDFPMPGLMEAERAVAIILRALAAGRVRVAFPAGMALAARAAGALPPGLRNWAMRRLPAKASDPGLGAG